MPSIQTYNLLTVRNELTTEFGLGAADAAMVDSKINQAIHWIVRQRESWPWLIRELVFNVQPPLRGSAQMFLGSVGVSFHTPAVNGTVDRYFIMQNGVINGDLLEGYLIVSQAAGGTNAFLDAQFLGGSAAGEVLPYTAVRAYYELPANFGRMLSMSTSDAPERPLEYAPPEAFEKIRRRITPLNVGSPLIYTVVPDPISASSGKFFVSFYPYPAERQTIRGMFYAEPENLSGTTDIPIIPIKNRLVLFYVAAWMLSIKLKHDGTIVGNYERQAAESLRRMMQEYELSGDTYRHRPRRRPIGSMWLDYDFPVTDQ